MRKRTDSRLARLSTGIASGEFEPAPVSVHSIRAKGFEAELKS